PVGWIASIRAAVGDGLAISKLPSCRSRLHVWRNHIYAERLRRPVRILDDDINLSASADENDIRYPQCGAVAVRRDTDHVCARLLNRCRHARLQVSARKSHELARLNLSSDARRYRRRRTGNK